MLALMVFFHSVVYIKCSTNNCATTVVSAFLEGVSEFSVLACIRSDRGGENLEILMITLLVF